MHCCCTEDARTLPEPSIPISPSSPAATPGRRRIATVLQWTLPVTALALIPKCPACVAAYFLFFTGIGLSIPAASILRWTFVALSLAPLIWLLCCAARRALTPHT